MKTDTGNTGAKRVAQAMALHDRMGENRQKAALDQWITLAQDGPVRRAALSPSLFGRGLQYTGLVEVLPEEDEYRHLIEGREVIRRFGRSGPEPFGALYETTYLSRLRAFYGVVRMTGAPNLRRFAVQSVADEEMTFSQLALPATDETGEVSHLAVMFDFPDPIRHIPTAPLRMHSPWRRLSRGTDRETIPGDRLWR